MRLKRDRRAKEHRGSAMLFVVLSLATMMVLGVMFMNRSSIFVQLSGARLDQLSAQNSMEAGLQQALATVETASLGIRLDSKLQLHAESPVTEESVAEIWDAYGSSTAAALNFLKHSIEVQALDTDGDIIPGHAYAEGFDSVFPSVYTDPDPSDDQYVQIRYEFEAREPIRETTALYDRIFFEYTYTVFTRGYGDKSYSQVESSQSGLIEIPVQAAPFSTFALFRSTARNQNGQLLVFAGGNTSAQVQEVFNGPVHINDPLYLYGHPIFNGPVSSTSSVGSWTQYTATGYSCCAVYNDSKTGGVDEIEMPTDIYSVVRVAAGDPDQMAAINNTPVTVPELISFLQYHQGGSFGGGEGSVPNGIYIPVESAVNDTPKGGVYVKGNAEVFLDVVQDQADFPADYWNNMDAGHQGCKFQKILIDSLEPGVASKEMFVGDDPCEVTYVFNPDSPATAPAVLDGRINGNIHIEGKVDKLGGVSRTRPAIAKDFGFTISAKKDIRVINDIQYEDVEYKEIDGDGLTGEDTVATAWGEVGGSGIAPTSEDIVPTISSESRTILGLISTHRNVLLHINAPANLNLHAAIFAGNDDAYSAGSGLGCGSSGASYQGCGFGNEGWDTKVGMGTFKFLGSVSEFKSQTMGRLSSPPTGYARRLAYDTRLRQDLMPPAFPLSDDVQAYPSIRHLKTWKISSAE